MRSPLASLEPAPPCARCERRAPGIRWGDLCRECREELEGRARPWARRVSLAAAVLVVLYARFGLTLSTGGWVWVAGIALAAYFLARTIVTQIAVEFLRQTPRS